MLVESLRVKCVRGTNDAIFLCPVPVLMLVFICRGLYFRCQMDPDNKPTREELKDEVIKVSKGLVGLGGFNLVRIVSKIFTVFCFF